MNFFVENLDILSKRFPFLYLLLISKIETKRKRLVYKTKKVDLKNGVDVLFIYKCAVAEESLEDIKKWLADKNKKLYFFDSDLNNMRLFFQTPFANFLLLNDNVSFHFFTQLKQLMAQITVYIKTKKVCVDTFVRETKYYHELKKEIAQYSLISFFSLHDTVFSYKVFKNFYSNMDKLKYSFLMNKFKNEFKNMPAVVLGAGPSLKNSFETIRGLQNKALLIAGGSAVTCLSIMGILPHLGVIVDPNFDEYQRMKESRSFEIPIVYSTRVNFGVFNTFNGPLGYIKNVIGGLFEIWLDKHLKIPGGHMCLDSHEKALTVTTVSLMLAKFLGCDPIILDGMDLSYSQGKRYSVDIIENNQVDKSDNQNYLFKDKNSKEVYSNLSWEIERDWISGFAMKNKKTRFFNATKDGLKIEGVKDVSLTEIEKKYLKKQFDFKSYLFYLSQKHKIINARQKDFSLMKGYLKHSFERSKNYLQDIINNEPEYKAVLAKDKLQSEIAYKYFLIEYDFFLKDLIMKKLCSEAESFHKLKEMAELFLQECK